MRGPASRVVSLILVSSRRTTHSFRASHQSQPEIRLLAPGRSLGWADESYAADKSLKHAPHVLAAMKFDQ
jgi:hypothetical protein